MSCPSGKELNPFTKRCVKKCDENKLRIADIDNQTFKCYARCKPGQRRNPVTLRCYKDGSAQRRPRRSATSNARPNARTNARPNPRPCKTDEERIYNPKLGVHKCYKRCKPGHHRNLNTMRCNKDNVARRRKTSSRRRNSFNRTTETNVIPNDNLLSSLSSMPPSRDDPYSQISSLTTMPLTRVDPYSQISSLTTMPISRDDPYSQISGLTRTLPLSTIVLNSQISGPAQSVPGTEILESVEESIPSSSSSSRSTDSATVIGEGSYGCIHRPSLRCENVRIHNYGDKVSKVATEREAKKEFDEYKIISQIDPDNKYHLGPPVVCNPKTTEYTARSIHKCAHDRFRNYPNGEKLSLLVMKDGGFSIEDYADSLMSKLPINAIQEIRNVLISMETIIEGLNVFIDRKVMHSDLKSQNIVYNANTGKALFIDFGLMTSMGKMKRKQSISVHWSYPLENVITDYELFKEFIKIKNKRNFARLACQKLHRRFGEPYISSDKIDKFPLFDLRKLIDSINNFTYDFVDTDLRWFMDEYEDFYINHFNFLNNSTDDEKRAEYANLREKNIMTFDIYGTSLVFWKLISVAKKIYYRVHGTEDEIGIDFSFIRGLQGIARQMCHPDYNQRIQIDELIPMYREFLEVFILGNNSGRSVSSGSFLTPASSTNS